MSLLALLRYWPRNKIGIKCGLTIRLISAGKNQRLSLKSNLLNLLLYYKKASRAKDPISGCVYQNCPTKKGNRIDRFPFNIFNNEKFYLDALSAELVTLPPQINFFE